ncbi:MULTISPECIES: putative T7SS-secreted protein [Streptomyces]
MTYDPGAATLPQDSQARLNGPLPQGLKSSPDIANPDYPDLGFNPVPGDCDTVKSLHEKLLDCAKVLQDTHGVVTKLMDGSYWQGDAAVAFREQIQDGPLPKNLGNAANSIRKAARHLARWHDELDGFRARAKRLNDDAKDARAALEAAKGRVESAAEDPNMKKKEGSRQHDDAHKALSRANGRVVDAQEALDRILARARGLAHEHEEKAGYRAGKIREATHKLAPHEPGLFDKAIDWVDENLPDILATVAGVIGLVAVIFAGPLGIAAMAALLLVSSALSAGALGLRLFQDPGMWASLKDGFTKGELDSDFWSNLVTVGGDVVGTVPGLGAVSLGARSAVNALRTGAESLTLAQKLASVGSHTMTEARAMANLSNPLVNCVVRSASDPEKAAQAVAVTSGVAGVGTAGFGLVNSAIDADDDGIKDGAVAGVDGTRLGFDVGGILSLARYASP